MIPVLEAQNLTRRYRLPRQSMFGARGELIAVNDVSLVLKPGEVLGVVGESGSGKSTLARLCLALEAPDAGTVRWNGATVTGLEDDGLRTRRRDAQMIFQDPYGSLDPRMRVLDSVAEPLDVAEPGLARGDREAQVAAILDKVGLPAEAMQRYPHQFSGGQRQRIAIARALITRPKLIVADEPVSALDVSIQAQILNLLMDIKAEFGLSILFISHDLGIVRYLADRVMVMHKGRVVEAGETEALFASPREDYTRRLIAAMPVL
jgi:peptide/nickel transport system ATP-binding protein